MPIKIIIRHWLKFVVVAATSLLVCVGIFSYAWWGSLWGYQRPVPAWQSEVGPLLNVFVYNQSQHHDPVPDCWYDAGDYVIFAHRNAQSVFYLSEAWRATQSPTVRADLEVVVRPQLTCLEAMAAQDWKQFRDQENHVYNLPPAWNERFLPQSNHRWVAGEGRDVALLLSATYRNLGDSLRAEEWRGRTAYLSRPMTSAHCCEEGPLVMSDLEMQALESYVVGAPTTTTEGIWAAHFTTLSALRAGNATSVGWVLDYITKTWDGSGRPFHYIGGNRDIAGTITMARLFRQQTNNSQYDQLADHLYQYLHGENRYNLDFTNFPSTYHPCVFFAACDVRQTLVNGIDEQLSYNPQRPDPWRIAEVQLTVQAQYVLAYILYHGL